MLSAVKGLRKDGIRGKRTRVQRVGGEGVRARLARRREGVI